MTMVVLDANALMMAFQFKINITSELDRLIGIYDIVIPSSVNAELRGLANDNSHAKMALSLASKYKEQIVTKKADDGILEAAMELEAIVLTNDKELRQRLRARGLKSIMLKGRQKLEFDS